MMTEKYFGGWLGGVGKSGKSESPEDGNSGSLEKIAGKERKTGVDETMVRVLAKLNLCRFQHVPPPVEAGISS